jgi:hypothetical protein
VITQKTIRAFLKYQALMERTYALQKGKVQLGERKPPQFSWILIKAVGEELIF